MRIDVWGELTCAKCRASVVALTEARAGEVEVVWRPFGAKSSFDAERLLAVALRRGGPTAQQALLSRFFQVYDAAAADPRDTALLAAAVEGGVPDAAEVLSGTAGTDDVLADLAEGATLGVTDAPAFVVDGRLTDLAGVLDSVRPDSALYRDAETLVDGNDPLSALKILEPLLARHGEEYSVRLLAARAYFASAQLNRARATLEQLVAERPVDDYARFMLGRVAERQSRPAEARSHYRVAVAMAPREAYREALNRVSALR